jgi:putative phosphoesterase
LKRIALISDTHGFLDDKIFKYFDSCDEIWHAGDIGDIALTDRLAQIKPLKAVYGNIDGQVLRRTFPKFLNFKCEQVDVFITHIGGYPGKYLPEISEQLTRFKPKLFICGHSHILRVMYDKKHELLHMNPGACGNSGFHKIKTLLRFTIDQKEIKDLEVIELGLKNLSDSIQ